MTDTPIPMLDKIRALLAMAEDTDNAYEAEAFSAKAAELMDKYRVDIAAVRGRVDDGYVYHREWIGDSKYLRASFSLLVVVAKHFGVVVLIPSTGNTKHPSLIGDRDDIVATTMMFESLLIQRDRACAASPIPPGTPTTKYRNSFCYGYAYRIGKRLADIRRAAEAAAVSESNSTALAVYDRGNAVSRWIEETEGRVLRNVNHNRATMDPYAAADGDRAARDADLGQRRMGAGPAAIGTGS